MAVEGKIGALPVNFATMNTSRLLLPLLLSCVSVSFAQPRQDNAGEKLVGAWRLVSVEGTDPTFHFAYDHPTGIIIYDRSGWMSVQIDVKGVRKPFVNGPAGGPSKKRRMPSGITSAITAPTPWM